MWIGMIDGRGWEETAPYEAASRIEKLETALKPFADLAYESDGKMYERLAHNLEDGMFIKARKALEGKDD
jgi:hypothetical protein